MMTEGSFSGSMLPAGDQRSPGRRRLVRYLFALFTLEVGLFLLIFPWTDPWYFNAMQDLHPILLDAWQDSYFRGALSGLGVVNIYLAVTDLLRTLRGV